jgi:glycosyltransferase involved in cell wall biosynthesis
MSGKVVVSQLGARMHYAVPAIFAAENRLAHFYTDICATKSWPRLVNALPKPLLPNAVRRLVGRRPKNVPANLITVFPTFGMRSSIKRLRERNLLDHMANAVWAGSKFSRLVARSGFHDAAGLYGFAGEALEQMQAARQQGLWTAVEQMIAPRDVFESLVNDEMQRFPEWAGPSTENPFAKVFAAREKAEWALADLIVCPSEFVRRHVVASGGVGQKCVVVPYGVDHKPLLNRSSRKPGPLRILTVGEVGLRKGSPYVVEAARLIGASAQFRLAGPTKLSDAILKQIREVVELRGIVPRAEMAEEYRWADVFLLPSICEGSATAIYEALAMGLPVITTENAGSVVQDGVEGFIVEPRDSEAIAAAIERLAADDQLREEMSAAALARAAEFTVRKYGERLVAAVDALLQPAQATGHRIRPG